MTKEQIKEKAKDFVSKIAGGTSKEMDYYANILAEFATEVTKELQEENAELKATNKRLLESCEGATMMYKHLTKAKEIIKKYYKYNPSCEYFYEDIDKEAEQFLSEVEK